MVSALETIMSSFTECPVEPLDGLPTNSYLTAVNMYLNQCSSGVHSNLGDGTLGYLILTATPAVYALVSTLQFVVPLNPGPTFIVPTPAPSAAALAQMTHEHAKNRRVFTEYATVDAACKRALMTLYPTFFSVH